MAEELIQNAYYPDPNTRIRDLEENHKLLKDRVLLIGQNLVEERSSTFDEIQEMKKTLLKLKEENLRMKEIISRMSEQVSSFARKEELSILQRQIDMIKPHSK